MFEPVIVLIAASLLIAIWLTARGIFAEALRALAAAEKIKANTMPIWAVATTNEVAGGLLAAVESIERKGAALGEALESHAGAR